MSESLRQAIVHLAEARRKLAGTKTIVADKKQQFERENRDLIALMNRESDAVAAAELMVRTLTVDTFKATGNKKPAPGVEIKMKKEYEVDEVAALKWAIEKDLCLIPQQLDLKAVTKLASVQPLPFVRIHEEPQPQISTDLDKVLAVAEATAPAADIAADAF